MATSGDGPRQIISDHERSVPDAGRRERGVHYTPPALAAELVRQGVEALGRPPLTVVDPSCGAGALLLAAADALLGSGVAPDEIVDVRLHGAELDASAAAAAVAALRRWYGDHGGDADRVTPRIAVLDALEVPADRWPERPDGGFDLVVGNPPFLDQLDRASVRDASRRRALADRFGQVGPYCDSAALFLLVGLELVGNGGVVSMLQPQSFLAARDTAEVRASALRRAELVALWTSDDQPFDAAVHVCAPVLRRRGDDVTLDEPAHRRDPSLVRVTSDRSGAAGTTRRTDVVVLDTPIVGAGAGSAAGDAGAISWAPLLAPASGLPVPPPPTGDRRASLATLASFTAGFRDEYYAVVAALCVDGEGVDGAAGGDRSRDGDGDGAGGRATSEAASAPVVSVGMIDPATLLWGSSSPRIGGRNRRRPRVDLDRLADDAPRVRRWVDSRRHPKVLVASQGRVIEAVADPSGAVVPLTPVIAVEPHDPDDLWLVLAALLAPTVSAQLLAHRLGTGRSSRSVRWSARSLAAVELPADEAQWALGAELAEFAQRADLPDRLEVLRACARAMCAAHGLDPDGECGAEHVEWWWGRVAERLQRPGAPSAVDELLG